MPKLEQAYSVLIKYGVPTHHSGLYTQFSLNDHALYFLDYLIYVIASELCKFSMIVSFKRCSFTDGGHSE